MIKLKKSDSTMSFKDSDYVLEKTDKLDDIISFLTPKFEGNWEIVLLDPKIKEIKSLLDNELLPKWIDIIIYTSQKKIDEITLEYPEMKPREVSRKEAFNEVIANVNAVIDNAAKNALYQALGDNIRELKETLTKLEKESPNMHITLKQVQSTINYSRRVYASQVLVAFLTRDFRRWGLFDKLESDIGTEIMYYALRKQVKKLLLEKEKYLTNQDVKQYVVKRVDAPSICYAYCVFANSNNYRQLRGIMYAIDNRSEKSLSDIQQNNL